MLVLNSISCSCIQHAVHAVSLYVTTTISVRYMQKETYNYLTVELINKRN